MLAESDRSHKSSQMFRHASSDRLKNINLLETNQKIFSQRESKYTGANVLFQFFDSCRGIFLNSITFQAARTRLLAVTLQLKTLALIFGMRSEDENEQR
jgi:hypothetical protein